jgi:hypothetical protein
VCDETLFSGFESTVKKDIFGWSSMVTHQFPIDWGADAYDIVHGDRREAI